jgi:hypothetical protein
LYHAVTGAPPYEVVGGNLVGVLYRIVHDPVPRTGRGGWLGPMLEGAMTQDPSRRWSVARIHDFLAAGPPGRATLERLPLTPPSVRSDPTGGGTVVLPSVAPAPSPGEATTRIRPRRRRRSTWLAALAVIAAVLLGVSAVQWHLFGGSNAPTAASTDAPIADFVKTYLATAPTDQARAFAMLTPRYQAASGGLDGYRSFWTQVDRIDTIGPIQVVSGQRPTATYDYTYSRRNGPATTETVTLYLVPSNGSYLIDGATSRQH